MTDDPDKRLTHLEYQCGEIKSRLDAGAEHFASLEQRLKPLGAKFWAPLVMAAIGLGSGWAYSVIRKPDTGEVKEMIMERSPYIRDRAEIQRVVLKYDADSNQMRDALNEIKVDQATINGKLDRVLDSIEKRSSGTRRAPR